MKNLHLAIEVSNLKKTFSYQRSRKGVWGAVRSLFAPPTIHEALSGIDFSINLGQRVAFIGPNGAGKSTTIKILTGILQPTSGNVNVLGLNPSIERKKLAYEIGTVFGQRSQLWHHLAAEDSFRLLQKIYGLDEGRYQKQYQRLVEVFDIGSFLQKPVKKLSLGQKMRCDIVASLLHCPKILFLDEPTIGLDVVAKLKIREVLNQMSKEFGTTLFLTSHDTADIEQICDRVIVLDNGKILRDGSVKSLKNDFSQKKRIRLLTESKQLPLDLPGLNIIDQKDYILVCELDLTFSSIDALIHETLKHTSIKDVTIEDPNMDEIIRELYAQK